ncbi:Hydrogen peroxide-inducible genes activator [Bradyrhizobium ivorense]|uniref:Hydrogen peroxide-inducible genes activator n=1 Tax=Bradyrhizobium ivorense TaxID=2511166 RepID=A0A508TPU4_9BRAD|nr:LysR substrate-binding domain-containing protein [Bradyrhizobium ivorense]VIO76409.1 Hydrogen peroxide-inducible genes activator [Bradyrhizobium ivorense]
MNLSGMSLRDLEYVVAIADHGSFVRAAEHCRVAQPSLSAQVRKLEAWLGIAIFERTTRRVIVTTEGRAFVEQARRVLAEARRLLTMAQHADEPFGGSLRLAAISTLGPYLFPRILQGLRRRYPKLGLILSEGLTSELVSKLIDGDLDAVLLSLPLNDPALATVALFSEPFLLACPKGHPASRKSGPTWEGLDAQDRLLLEEGHCLREQALAGCSAPDRSNRLATSLETLKYMVAAGEGCTLVPALAVSERDAVVYSRLRGTNYSRKVGLAWRRSDPRGSEFSTLAERLRQIASAFDIDVDVT